jgi:hypothetical protein
MIVTPPHENAPKFVKANVSIKVDEFITFLENHAAFVRAHNWRVTATSDE